MKKSNETLYELATIQTAVEELFKKHIGICGIGEDGVHVSESFFVKLFEDKREIVGRKDFTSKTHPFMYFTHFFGTKFFCISENPDLFPTYPVEKLALDILERWFSLGINGWKYSVYYVEGSYQLLSTDNLLGHPIYSYEQRKSDESVTLEAAILDHMEVKHNENL